MQIVCPISIDARHRLAQNLEIVRCYGTQLCIPFYIDSLIESFTHEEEVNAEATGEVDER